MHPEKLPLRQIALELGSQHPKTKKPTPDVARLWSLLNSGQLVAGVHIPGKLVTWLDLPASFWTTVGSHDLRKVLINKNRKDRTGSYPIHIARIADPYWKAVEARARSLKADKQADALLAELRIAFKLSMGFHEVVVTRQEWERYSNSVGEVEPHRKTTPKLPKETPGTKQSGAWRELCEIIGAHCLVLGQSGKPPKALPLAKDIYATAVRELPDFPELPSVPTLRGRMKILIDKAEKLSG
jgi:hypothetical protein